MPDVLTFLLIEVPPDDHHATAVLPGAVVDDAVRAAAGALVADPQPSGDPGRDRRVATAVFHIAGDAALAAVNVARSLPEPPRMALCTGGAEAQGATFGGGALARAAELLRLAHPQQILATASTAVMASPALPRQAELVDRGVRSLDPTIPPERIYELRPGSGDPRDLDDDSAGSNLEWARRAAHGQVLGREEPLAALEAAWKATLHGERRTVLLSGEGGIGKTTVAAALALRLHAEGALVLYGRWDPEAIAPYQAMREALGSYANASSTQRLRADLEGWGDELSRLLPDVGARVGGVRSPLRGDPDSERLRLFEAIETWLDLLAHRRGLLLVLDDLHWAERSSWMLLDHLQRSPGTAPRMIVGTVREGEAAGATSSGWRELMRGDEGLEHIRLEGLEQTVVARLIQQTVGHTLGALDDDVVAWLTQGTAGNPLFVQEVLRSVSGSDDTGSALRAARDAVPGRLADVVRWRLTQLPAATSALLADAALIGSTFDLDLLASATATPPVALRRPLDDGVRSGLLQESGNDRYGFTHDLVRRALQESREPGESASLHRRIAVALATRALEGGDVSAAEVAHHHLLGADYQTIGAAVRWARNAAEAARRETAFDTAVTLLSRVVAAHDRLHGDAALDTSADSQAALACELRLELAEAHDRAGELSARDQRHLEAANLARDLDRTDLFVRAALGYCGRLPAGPPPNRTARGLLEEALDRLGPEDGRSRALLLARLAQVRHQDAPYDQRRALSDEAVAMARRLDNPVVLASVLMSRCLTLDGPGDIDEQLGVGAEVSEIGEQTGDPDVVLQGARIRIPALVVLGRHDEANALAVTFAQLANEVRHYDHVRLAAMWDILWTGLQGSYDEFEEKADELHRRLIAAGHPQADIIHFGQTFATRWLHGTLERSRDGLEVIGGADAGHPVLWSMAMWAEAATGNEDRALARLATRDPDEFVGNLQLDVMWWPTITGCTVSATCGDRGWAAALYRALEPLAGRNLLASYTSFFGAADHHLGTLALTLGDADDAVERLERGLERHRALGASGYVALSARWLARALEVRGRPGDRKAAATYDEESRELASRFDLAGLPDFPATPGPHTASG